jgi:hypothetical protein
MWLTDTEAYSAGVAFHFAFRGVPGQRFSSVSGWAGWANVEPTGESEGCAIRSKGPGGTRPARAGV